MRTATPSDAVVLSLDLNATSPGAAVLLDGGIIGGVPYPHENKNSQENGDADWHCPSLIVSGPHPLPDSRVSQILNIRHVSEAIGVATGIKMCYAALTKGFVALSIQSFTTAHRLGVLSELRGLLEQYNPATLRLAEKGLVTMPPKAYRWVGEMEEIGETMGEGGFERELYVSFVEFVIERETRSNCLLDSTASARSIALSLKIRNWTRRSLTSESVARRSKMSNSSVRVCRDERVGSSLDVCMYCIWMEIDIQFKYFCHFFFSRGRTAAIHTVHRLTVTP